ncbi:MAG: SET domain-containing protein-lysine N-methyltransferase [Alphaproteobacteria bacterium]|nr:SET domain-containing protein-lysine N-methyltransferase [Alphaproteobacteria bacterium]
MHRHRKPKRHRRKNSPSRPAAAKKSIRLERKKGLYLKDVGGKGRGVFCAHNIAAGEELEITPALLLNEAATKHADQTILVNYTFITGKISKRLRDRAHIKKTDRCSSVIMGVASFCNHTDTPNAEILWEEQNGTLYHTLQATRPIPKNTEICTTYGDGWFENREW